MFDQAIFTSARSGDCEGYHVVAASQGVSHAELRQLSAWGPSHDSLAPARPGEPRPPSLNFHPLGSRFCLSQTTARGEEYSLRAGPRIFTHCLVLAEADWSRFHWNPFELDRAATAAGLWHASSEPPAVLPPLVLGGRAPPCDETAVLRALAKLGAAPLAALLDAALGQRPFFLAGAPAELTFRALFSLLPIAGRPGCSLTTGLRFSLRRPFHWQVAPQAEGERRRLAAMPENNVVDAAEIAGNPPVLKSLWARQVGELLARHQISEVGRLLHQGSVPLASIHEQRGLPNAAPLATPPR